MTNRTTRHVRDSSGPARGRSSGLSLGAGRLGTAKSPNALTRQGVWDHSLDGPAPKVTPIYHVGMQLLDSVARLGFSLFITAGFAAGSCLYSDITLDSPTFVNACWGIFLWTLALISCVTSRRK
jgi:hypothetical protein